MDRILEVLGFSEYKRKAYAALVTLVKASPLDIARKAGIPSSKIYEILDWLYEKGYASVVQQKPLIYKANNPKAVLKSEVNARISELKKIEEQIKKLRFDAAASQKGDFEMVYGRDAFFKKVKEAASCSEKTIIAVVKNWRLDYELKEITSEFVNKGGIARFLGPVTKENREKVKEWQKIGVAVKNFQPDTTRFTVWDCKTIAIGFKSTNERDYFSLWIENEYLGRILTEHFNALWNKR